MSNGKSPKVLLARLLHASLWHKQHLSCSWLGQRAIRFDVWYSWLLQCWWKNLYRHSSCSCGKGKGILDQNDAVLRQNTAPHDTILHTPLSSSNISSVLTGALTFPHSRLRLQNAGGSLTWQVPGWRPGWTPRHATQCCAFDVQSAAVAVTLSIEYPEKLSAGICAWPSFGSTRNQLTSSAVCT